MDPLTAALNLAQAIVVLLGKVWEATPEADRAVAAKDLAQNLHQISAFMFSLQKSLGPQEIQVLKGVQG